jgi:trehalose utilization protein
MTRFLLPAFASLLALASSLRAEPKPIRVTVWDERQPEQKTVYPNFLGNHLADTLRKSPGLEVTSVGLDDPQQGLGDIDHCDVLVWWGHKRHDDVENARVLDIVKRIKEGRLALLALHSAHWSKPFDEAMNERARGDALAALAPDERAHATLTEKPLFPGRAQPKYDTIRTPFALYKKKPDGTVTIDLTLPNCCFPAVRADGKPSQMRTLLPQHPIAAGLPATWKIDQTEMYEEPFHVPTPDAVVFEERWEPGEWFRSGMAWNVGQGRVFYFRPGHETFPVYLNPTVLKVIDNAVHWLGTPAGK